MTTRILRTWRDGDDRLLLRDRDGVLDLVLGNVVLLSSAALETERAFGRLAATTAQGARVVIGGLGFGSTLRGVLEVLPADGTVVVVEKLRAVIEIARAEAADLLAGALDDPRVQLVHGDVGDVLDAERELTAILLDVDNGPGWASFRTNARLYADAALTQMRRTLRSRGILAVWSGYPADAFVARLRKANFIASVVPLKERGIVRARAYVGTVQNGLPPEVTTT
jgi:spermidine synthase